MNGAIRWFSMLCFVVLTACSTRPANTEVTACTYPDSFRTPAPEFICNADIEGFPITVLRVSKERDFPVSERIQAVLALEIERWSRDWALEWFGEPENQSKAMLYLNDLLTEQARVVRSRMSPKSNLWLLLGIPLTVEEIQQKTQQALAQP